MSDKDYYEILGVRPNAGHAEIELAYKGRRGQYHPDRYGQSDAETHAWATGKMQEVNEAYQALTNSELRVKFDQCRASNHSASQPTQERAAPAPEAVNAAVVLLKSEWEWFHDKVYARPNIPQRKLEGAISSYAPGVLSQEVIVLLDDTLFGGAKEGLLVTNDAVYCKQKFEGPRRLDFKAIRQVEPGTDSRVIINGQEFFKADLIDHLAILTFASRLSAVFRTPKSDSTDLATPRGVSGVDSLWILHRGAMAALRTELEEKTLLIDELIDRQMRCVADQFSSLRSAVESRPRSQQAKGSVDAECAELALMLFLILHYYGFSKLPSDFKAAAGKEFTRLHEVSEIYKAAFREGFLLVFGCSMKMDEEDLLMMPAMFFHRDGNGNFELNVPREEALSILFSRLQIPGGTTRELIIQFEGHAESWLEAISEIAGG